MSDHPYLGSKSVEIVIINNTTVDLNVACHDPIPIPYDDDDCIAKDDIFRVRYPLTPLIEDLYLPQSQSVTWGIRCVIGKLVNFNLEVSGLGHNNNNSIMLRALNYEGLAGELMPQILVEVSPDEWVTSVVTRKKTGIYRSANHVLFTIELTSPPTVAPIPTPIQPAPVAPPVPSPSVPIQPAPVAPPVPSPPVPKQPAPVAPPVPSPSVPIQPAPVTPPVPSPPVPIQPAPPAVPAPPIIKPAIPDPKAPVAWPVSNKPVIVSGMAFAPGKYDFGPLGIVSNIINTLSIPQYCCVTLFTGPGFTGTRTVTTTDGPLPAPVNCQSMWVQQYITVYTNNDFSGQSQTLTPGSYTSSQLTIGVKNISSLRIPPGLLVTLYAGDNFTGQSKILNTDSSYLADFNDMTCSIIVQ